MAEKTAADPSGILPASHWMVSEDDDDKKSTVSQESSTASLASSIFEYRILHGRRYHSDRGEKMPYWGANDEEQNLSLEINHYACTRLLDDKLHLAPLEKNKVKEVLDLGTGTGIWAIDFAGEFPDAKVLGTDLSPIQPSWTLPNVSFQIDDYTLQWTFKPETYDYIHTRWLLGTTDDWTRFYKQVFTVLKPGGWFETHEMSAIIESDDGTVKEDSALGQWGKIFIQGGAKLGRSFRLVQEEVQRKAMEAAGFVDIQERDFKMPIGGWPRDPRLKEIGLFGRAVLDQDPEGYVLYMVEALGWTQEERKRYVKAVKRELRDPTIHPYYRQKVVWGRKPE